MSKTVDERIVQMTFDNSKFESNAKQTVSTLDKLKQSLNFSGTETSLDSLSQTVVGVSSNFSALEEIATGALRRIGEYVSDFAINLVKSLTFDQLFSGWEAYETELKTVQVMMSATGKSIEEIEEVLEEVNWYADETSYSYDALTSTIKSFISQNIELKDSISYVQGIANMAGLAGAEASQATHAMEGFAKAIGSGYMSAQNWSWIKTAGMETAQVKQMFIDAAVEAKKLTKVSDDLYHIVGEDEDKTVSLGTFSTYLSTKWLNTDVMLKAMGTMSEYSEVVYDMKTAFEESFGDTLTTSEVMEILGDITNENSTGFEEAVKVLNEYDNKTYTTEEALKRLNDLLNSTSKLGYENAQVYRTFSDAINSTKTAVTSAWRTIFKDIFGNVVEARETWTRLGDWLYDAFAQPFWDLEELISNWKDLGGRSNLIEGLANFGYVLDDLAKIFKEAFGAIFDAITPEDLKAFTDNFREFGETLRLFVNDGKDLQDFINDGTFTTFKDALDEFENSDHKKITTFGQALYNTLTIIGIAIRDIGELISAIWSTTEPLRTAISGLISTLVDLYEELTGTVIVTDEAGTKTIPVFKKAIELATKILEPFVKVLTSVVEGIDKLVQNTIDVKTFGDTIKEAFSGLQEYLQPVLDFISKIADKVSEIFDKLVTNLETAYSENNGDILSLAALLVVLKKTLDTGWLMETWETFKKVLTDIKTVITDTIDDLQWSIEASTYSQYVTMFENIAKAILEISFALLIVASIDENQLTTALSIFTLIVGAIALFITMITPILGSISSQVKGLSGKELTKGIKGIAESVESMTGSMFTIMAKGAAISSMLVSFGFAILEMAAAVKLISGINLNDLITGIIGFGAILAGLLIFVKSFGKILTTMSLTDLTVIGPLMTAIGFALIEMAGALRIMGTMDFAQIASGVLGLSAILFVIAYLIKVMKTSLKGDLSGSLEKIGGILIAVGFGMLEIAVALKIVGSMSWSELIVALTGFVVSLAAILGLVVGITKLSGLSTKMELVSGLMIGLGFALLEIAVALKVIGTMSWKEMGVALISVVVVLAALAAVIIAINNLSNNILGASALQIGGAFMMLGFALLEIAAAVKIMSTINATDMSNSLLCIISIIAALGLFMAAMNAIGVKQFIVLAGGMLLLTPALLGMAAALLILSAVPSQNLISAAAAIGILLLAFAGVSMLLEYTGVGAKAFLSLAAGMTAVALSALVMASSLFVFALALHTLEDVNLLTVLPNLLAFIAIFAIVSALAPSIGLVVVQFEKFAKALLYIALAIGIVALALPKLSLGLLALETLPDDAYNKIIEIALTVVQAVIDVLVGSATKVANAVVEIIVQILRVLGDHIYEIVVYIVEIINDIILALAAMIPQFLDACRVFCLAFILGIVNVLAKLFDEDAEVLMTAFGNLINSILKFLIRLVTSVGGEAGGVLADALIDVLGLNDLEYIEDYEAQGTGIATKVATGLEDGVEEVGDATEGITTEITDELNTVPDMAEDTGSNIISGLLGQFKDEISLGTNSDIYQTMYEYNMLGVAGQNDAWGVASPSKQAKRTGMYVVLGFIKGIKDNMQYAAKATGSMATEAMDSLSSAISMADSIVDDGLNPTITPVLDLSNVESGVGTISSLFGKRSMNVAGSISSGIQNGGSKATVGAQENTINVNFTVDKAGGSLTDADIRKYGNTIAKVVNEKLGLLV